MMKYTMTEGYFHKLMNENPTKRIDSNQEGCMWTTVLFVTDTFREGWNYGKNKALGSNLQALGSNNIQMVIDKQARN